MIEDVLTHREMEIATLIAEGRKFKDIALTLGISYQTVKNHSAEIYEKLGFNGNPKYRPSVLLTRVIMEDQERSR